MEQKIILISLAFFIIITPVLYFISYKFAPGEKPPKKSNCIILAIVGAILLWIPIIASFMLEQIQPSNDNVTESPSVISNTDPTTTETTAATNPPEITSTLPESGEGESLPDYVNDEEYNIYPSIRYHYCEKETTESFLPEMDGWILYDTVSEYGEWGPWGNWQDTPREVSETREDDKKTQYRSRQVYTKKEYVSSTDWSEDRQDISASSNIEESSRTIHKYGYYYFECPNCHAHLWAWGENMACFTWAGGCGNTIIPEDSWHQFYFTLSWNDANLQEIGGTGRYYTEIDGERYYKWVKWVNGVQYGEEKDVEEYSYRTYTEKKTYSDPIYTEEKPTPSETLEVDPNPILTYRYRERSKTLIYKFYRWGAWSPWQESKIEEGPNIKVEETSWYSWERK